VKIILFLSKSWIKKKYPASDAFAHRPTYRLSLPFPIRIII